MQRKGWQQALRHRAAAVLVVCAQVSGWVDPPLPQLEQVGYPQKDPMPVDDLGCLSNSCAVCWVLECICTHSGRWAGVTDLEWVGAHVRNWLPLRCCCLTRYTLTPLLMPYSS